MHSPTHVHTVQLCVRCKEYYTRDASLDLCAIDNNDNIGDHEHNHTFNPGGVDIRKCDFMYDPSRKMPIRRMVHRAMTTAAEQQQS